MENSSLIPGFRFHPTDHELVMYYLKRKLMGKKILVNAIAEVNIYDFSPWDLPDKSALRSGDLEWFFFCPKSRKYTSGSRLNRATENGFWKATGKDRKVEYKGRMVATIKTLVFHIGQALKGERTNWVMHEYNMKDQKLADEGIIQDMFVLCKIFEKEGVGPKNGAQYGAPFKEEEWDNDDDVSTCSGSQLVFGPCGPTNKLDYNQMGPASLSVTEPGSSTVTFSANETANYKGKGPAICAPTEPGSSGFVSSENVTCVHTPVNDDVMLFEDLASILGVSTDDLNDNNINNKGVEVDKMKEVKGARPNEEDGIYGDLMKLVDLDDFLGIDSSKFGTDGADYTLDMIMGTDGLDADLGRFWVD